MTDTCDHLIVGAGILGLATAWELKRRAPACRVLVLDKEPAPGRHASGRNSGVLHSGLYYASDTLKAKVCARGAARMRAFAAEQGIPCRKEGKVVIATSSDELASLERLMKNARDNGIRVAKLDAAGIRALEPHARVHVAGIHSPDTAVIDSRAVLDALRRLLAVKGVEFAFNERVLSAAPERAEVRTEAGIRGFGFLFNCAGAHADTLARAFGMCRDHALVPFKGIYYKLSKSKDHLVRNSIYPVPDLRLPFLGVHLTRVVGGDVYVGPTAIPALGRENYGVFSGLAPGEALGILWRLGGMYAGDTAGFRHLAHTEIRKYMKSHFLTCAQKLVEGLSSEDLLPSDKVGIRPQLVHVKARRLEMDYILESTPNSLHVLNAISPAFTSAFAFAEMIVDRSGLYPAAPEASL